MKHKTLLITLAICILAAAGISYYLKTQSSSGLSEPSIKVNLGIAKEPLASLAMIADQQGFFSEQGLDVTVTQYKGGKQALVNGLLAGNVDMATTADVPIVVNSFQHNRFKIIATIGSSDNEPRIIARKDHDILQAQDLRGKKVMTKKGSAVHFFLNVFLSHTGLSKEKINLSFTKNGNEMVNLLAKGDIDAFSHREPFISQAKESLGDNAVIFEKPGAYTKTYNLVVSNKFVEKKSTAIKKVLAAFLKAEIFVEKNPAKTIKLVSGYIGLSEDSLKNIWQDIELKISLDKTLISTLTAEAWWVISDKLITGANVPPDYLKYLLIHPLKAIKPEVVNVR